ncbi:serine hydrolase [Lactococcus garvieae]|nr:serine hydrolase [Lactococcus garvieae]
MQKLKNKFNLAVWLVMIVMIIPAFFVLPQKSKEGSAEAKVKEVKQNQSSYHTEIPSRAVTLTTIPVYKDENLQQKSGELPEQKQLDIIKLKNNVFELANHTYIKADTKNIVSDTLLSKQIKKTTVYTAQRSEVYYNPFTTYDKEVYTTLPKGQQFSTNQIAETYWGTYYEVNFNGGQTGWINSENINLENPKMLQVQDMLRKKYNDSKYSIYVKQLDDSFTVGVNQDKKMYAASLSKLPILYWTQKRLNEGKAALNDNLQYNTAINTFKGSFEAGGTGILPVIANNANYSLSEIIDRTAKNSDNVGSNLLAYYETGQFSPAFRSGIESIAGQAWDPVEREASAEMVGRILEALYKEGGYSFNALFGTQFDDTKIQAGVPKNVRVAHKIGAADAYNHDAAIIFSSEPYILVVETKGGSDDVISQISKDVYEVLK